MAVEIANISISGVMIDVTHEHFETLIHKSATTGAKAPVETDLRFNLTPDQPEINVICRAVYIRRIAQNQYYIGLKFLNLDAIALDQVKQFVQDNL